MGSQDIEMNKAELVPGSLCVRMCLCVCVLGRILISKQCSCQCREVEGME